MTTSLRGSAPRRALRGFAALVLPTVVVLASLEIAVRATGAERFMGNLVSRRLYPVAPGAESTLFGTRIFDPILSWRLRPNGWLPNRIGRINSFGFVGPELDWRKAPGTIRILTLGDSVTYGLWACGKAAFCRRNPYPSALELLLWGRTGRDAFEVIDAGVYGYNSLQGLRYYRSYLGSLDADIVTVMFGWNDHGHLRGIEGREPRNPVARAIAEASARLASYRTFAGLAALILADAGGTAKRPAKSDPHKPRVGLEDFEYHLETLIGLVRARGKRVLLITEPAGPKAPPEIKGAQQTWTLNALPTYEALIALHAQYNDRVRAVAARLAVPLVDADAEFERRDASRLFTPYDLVHPNEAGHALIAEMIYGRLVDEGWVEAPPRPLS